MELFFYTKIKSTYFEQEQNKASNAEEKKRQIFLHTSNWKIDFIIE